MLAAERRKIITQMLQEKGTVRVADLSGRFGVSSSTIRRDLKKLEQQNIIRRSYGGATLDKEKPKPADDPLADEKARIGQAAANLISGGETIFVGAGSTALAVARALTGHGDLTVITNSLSVASHLAAHSKLELIVVGGLVHRASSAMTGHLAEQALQDLRADKAILGVQGISTPDGLTSDDLLQVQMAQSLLAAVPEVIIVADHSKFGRVCTAHIAPVDRADLIVTGREAPDSILWELAELEVKVILA